MQYWKDVDGDSAQLLLVSNEAVYAETYKGSLIEAQISRLQAGESPAQVFGDKATHVVLRGVKRVQQSSADSDIDFEVGEGKEAKTESLTIEDAGVRDAVFGAVEQATQGRFRRYEDTYSKARAAFASALTFSLLAMGTAIAANAATAIRAADEIEITGRKKGLKQMVVWVLDTLGPWGVSILGGLLCALALFVLIQRVQAPPHLQMLQSKPYRPQGPIITGIKYALLAALWVVLGPGLFG